MALTTGGSAHILWWFTTSTLECFYEEDLSTKSSTSQASARLQESDANPSRAQRAQIASRERPEASRSMTSSPFALPGISVES